MGFPDEKPLDYVKFITEFKEALIKDHSKTMYETIADHRFGLGQITALDNVLKSIKIEQDKRQTKLR